MDVSEDPLATTIMRQVGHAGNFLATKHTRQWFKRELFIPSPVIDRDYRQVWETKGAKNIGLRAHERVEQLVATYQPKPLPEEVEDELVAITLRAAQKRGMEKLPLLRETSNVKRQT
jgi:trimethylamine--corrinoid protein Co-methyltransferase